MILEGMVTTMNEDGSANISPMGPMIDEDFKRFHLRPFPSSQTFENLRKNPFGVLHIVDDVMLVAQGAIKRWQAFPELVPADTNSGKRIANACRAFEFNSHFLETSDERSLIECEVVKVHEGPRFFGFNRAKHAVIEAAILATRIDFLPLNEIQSKFVELKIIVDKTGGTEEHSAFELLNSFLGEFSK